MYGDTGALLVDDILGEEYIDNGWFNIELNWNRNIYQFYIDGILYHTGTTGFIRSGHGGLIIHPHIYETINIDEVIVKNEYTHIQNFTVPESALTKYASDSPYRDISLGDSFEYKKVSGITIDGSDELRFYLQSGDTFYKVVNGEWNTVTDPTDVLDANEPEEIRDYITRFNFDPSKQISFRVFFRSTGLTQTYLNSLSINKIQGPVKALDYSKAHTYVRVKLGEPIMPVELTDQQIDACIDDTLYYVHRYRNRREEMEIFDLIGTYREGWEIPEGLKQEDILDIIIRPIIPFGYLQTGRKGVLGNLYLQYLFRAGGHNISSNIADFRITMSALKDYSILLGTQPKWEILNNKIRIWPEPPAGARIGIRYLSILTPDDVLEDNFFKDLLLAEAKIALGTIRGTFPAGVPGGTDVIPLNGDQLLQEGKAEKERAIQRMMKAQDPLFLDFF